MGDTNGEKSTVWYSPPVGDSLQFWREERVDGAVYNVYLKKVRYHSDEVEADDDGAARLQWRTERVAVIKAGTLERLVEAFANENGELDSSYVSIFMATFRSFATTKEVLDQILDRYLKLGSDSDMKQEIKEKNRKSLRSVISVWMDNYPEDFKDPPSYPCLRQLMKFAEEHMHGSDLSHRAKHKLDKFNKEDEQNDANEPVDYTGFQFDMLEEVNFMMQESKLQRPIDFDSIPIDIFAEQLTYIDSELFKKVVPHHCLGSTWSRRDKKRGVGAPSVFATVSQFNAVSYRVIATILKYPQQKSLQRAKVVEKWIEIAQELRILKNFSSLKAIISGLQSNPVYRLRRVWAVVDRESIVEFEELSEIFSEENNQVMCRELLMREGTAKFADPTATLRSRRKSSVFRKSVVDSPTMVSGTVPYLGTFLTDLTMIDTAILDTTEDGLINVDKRRKEFELMAQIKLLQSAAHMYNFKPDTAFFEWFHSIRIYDDKESYELSCDIEPVTPSTPKEVKGHKKKSSLGFFSPRRPSTDDNLSLSAASVYSDDASIYSAPDQHRLRPPMGLRHSVSATSLGSVDSDCSSSPFRSPDFRIVKVVMETSDSHLTNVYKSIILSNSDHTSSVMRNILIKYNIEGKPQDYCLAQVLPDGELELPEKGNIYYAINTSVPEVKFIVRKKTDLERMKAKQLKNKGRKTKKFTL